MVKSESYQKTLISMTDDNVKIRRAFAVQSSELLFTVLPFIVIFLVLLYQDKSWIAYLMAPEWAFASAVLFGQTIVKLVQGTLRRKAGIKAENVALFVSALIVLGLTPSMSLLAIVLLSPTVPLWVGITQVVFAFVAAAVFVILGSISHEISE